MLGTGIVVAGALLGGVMQRGSGGRARSLLVIAALVAVALVLYPIVVPDGYDAFVSRWESAAAVEGEAYTGGVFGRYLLGFVDFFRLIGGTPLIGYGLGLGGNASTTLGASIGGVAPLMLAETDWARHIIDLGPVLGVLFIVYRIALVGWMGWLVFRALRRDGDVLPLLLYAFLANLLLLGQITGQGTLNGYGWMFAGFCIAAAACAGRDSGSVVGTTPTGALIVPRFPNLLR
jgi:hypothetical protein